MSCLSLAGYWSVTVFGRKHCYRLYTEHLNEAVHWVCAVQKVIDSKVPVQTPTQLLMRDVEVSSWLPALAASAGLGWMVGAPRALAQQWVSVLSSQLGGPSAAAAVALPPQEHCDSPEVLEQIYRCNPILRYTSSPLYAPLLPFPYGSLDQSGEGWAGVLHPGLAGAVVRQGWVLRGVGRHWAGLGRARLWVQRLAAGNGGAWGSPRGC